MAVDSFNTRTGHVVSVGTDSGWSVSGGDTCFALTGNVAIGTAPPTKRLSVTASTSGDGLEVTGTQDPGVRWTSNSANAAARNWGMFSNFQLFGDFVVRTSNDLDGDPYHAGTTRLAIDGSGNVGIGTADPAFKLDVADGNSRLGGVAVIAAEPGYEWWAGAHTEAGTWQLTHRRIVDGNHTNAITVDTSNRIGIGTTRPTSLLDMQGGCLQLQVTNPTLKTDDRFGNGGFPTYSYKSVSVRATYNASAAEEQTGHAIHALTIVPVDAPGAGTSLGITGGVETFNGAIEADGVAGYVNNRTVMGSHAIAVHGITRGVGGPNTFGFRADSEANDHCQAGIIIDCSTSNNESGANSFKYGAHVAVANSAGFIVYPAVDANLPAYPFLLRNAAGTDLFYVDSAGNERATSNAVISDERIKNVLCEFKRGLFDIEKIEPIQFSWKSLSGGEQAGLSAQNVQSAIPESVTVGEDGLLSVSDRPILAALINAVKELSARVRELESAAGL